MTVQVTRRLVFLFIVFVTSSLQHYCQGAYSTLDPRDEFYHHQIIRPEIFHTGLNRQKRESSQTDSSFHDELTVTFDAYNKSFLLKLLKNINLLPEHHFQQHTSDGKTVINKPIKKMGEHCHYQGYVENVNDSWVAISSCNGLSGVIFDGKEVYYIQPSNQAKNSSIHFLFKESHRKRSNLTCGSQKADDLSASAIINRQNRHRRAVSLQPFRSGSSSITQYLEMILVMDNAQFRDLESNKDKAIQAVIEVANILYGLCLPLNFFISLVGVVIWSERDEVTITSNADDTLTRFLEYRANQLSPYHRNDNAQLLSGVTFGDDIVGKALKGTMCTTKNSGGINMFHSKTHAVVAATVAHELGHNFGLDHDTRNCSCINGRCIMAPSSSSVAPLHWSDCSMQQLDQAFKKGLNYCLRNIPDKVQGSSCGNGNVEKGEECDCGLPQFCTNPCCNATTCQLVANAACATGACCDLTTCQVKKISTVCRAQVGDCDLPEYCDGSSNLCPADFYIHNGVECGRNKAYCYNGQCKSHLDQCQLLWGPTAKNGPSSCYYADRGGDCGYDFVKSTSKPCASEDYQCGRLHCLTYGQKLKFGVDSSLVSYLTVGNLKCYMAFIDVGLHLPDQGMVPNGAKCGKDKACSNQRCVPVSEIRNIDLSYCGVNGVFNNKGNCHCKVGLSPPHCSSPGVGGSVDSGPPSDPYAYYEFMVALFIIFLGIIPSSAIIACTIYYTRGHLKNWWTTKLRQVSAGNRGVKVGKRKNVRHSPYISQNTKAPVISKPIPVVNKKNDMTLGTTFAGKNLVSSSSPASNPYFDSHTASFPPVFSISETVPSSDPLRWPDDVPCEQLHPSASQCSTSPIPSRPAPPTPDHSISPMPARPAPHAPSHSASVMPSIPSQPVRPAPPAPGHPVSSLPSRPAPLPPSSKHKSSSSMSVHDSFNPNKQKPVQCHSVPVSNELNSVLQTQDPSWPVPNSTKMTSTASIPRKNESAETSLGDKIPGQVTSNVASLAKRFQQHT